MVSNKTFIFLAVFASTVSMILSIPQLNPVPQHPFAPYADSVPSNGQEEEPVRPNELVIERVPELRTFGSLFNLSAYLANAPQNQAALNFIPLITLLTAKG